MDGSATLTTVLSSMIMKSPTATAARVHHFRRGPVKISGTLTLRTPGVPALRRSVLPSAPFERAST